MKPRNNERSPQMDLFDLGAIDPLVLPEKHCLVYCGEGRCDCSRCRVSDAMPTPPYKPGDFVTCLEHHDGLTGFVTEVKRTNDLDHFPDGWMVSCDVQTSQLVAKCVFSGNGVRVKDGAAGPSLIDGWVKTRKDGKGLMPVATLIQIPNDACDYRPARFALSEGVTVARWPSGDPALYFDGERIPLFTAVERKIARELR